VGLTGEVELKLRDVSLIDFYNGKIPAFKALAARAYSYAYSNLQPTGLPLRQDDVAAYLVFALEVNGDLRTYLSKKRLPQKFWYRRFADLIIDRLWEELKK
jgi:hypothetical protein